MQKKISKAQTESIANKIALYVAILDVKIILITKKTQKNNPTNRREPKKEKTKCLKKQSLIAEPIAPKSDAAKNSIYSKAIQKQTLAQDTN